ncbi:MAG: twin-arginine translocase TatA/TatE family subunit [Chloroflexi bacterium]|nr:MAG: twin-arginine translocase TatA/TatE family subunit [Chloroflexota bacterium]
MFDVGIPELILILVVALVVFGPGKLPEIGSSLGKTIREFRKATQGISDEIKSVTTLEPEDEMRTRLIAEQKTPAQNNGPTVPANETADTPG